MEPIVRDTLRQLIVQHGRALCDDPPRCEAMLRDLCGQHKPEIALLITALQQRVPAALLANAAGLPSALLVDQLRQRLARELFLTAEAAQWAVETWALALGLSDGPAGPPALAPLKQIRTPAPAPVLHAEPTTRLDGPPDIHGWPADKVQELQRAAARTLGLPVVFCDTLGSPITLPKPQGVLARLKRKVPTVVTDGPEMVIIPAGSFMMISPYDEDSQQQVIHTRPFALGRYAVTFDDYDAFCGATHRGSHKWKNIHGAGELSRRPVINVTWGDVVAYCRWLSEQTGQHYRLPSESEWEYACRAGTTTAFHFGDSIDSNQANYGRSSAKDRVWTEPVGTYPPNPWGLYEMHGNVREWVEDQDRSWMVNGGPPPDGSAWKSDSKFKNRRLRGGSWYDGDLDAKSASQQSWEPAGTSFHIGFRVARTLTP